MLVLTESRFKKLAVLAALLGAAACAAAAVEPELTGLIFWLPCGLVAEVLWELAMTGEGWRIFAIVIYVLICFLPALGLLLIRRRRRPWREDWLLLVLSAALFLLLGRALDSRRDMYSVFAQMGLFSVLTAWLVLRLLRCIGASDDARLVKLSRIAVALLGLIYGFTAGCATAVILVLGCLRALRLVNTLGPAGELTDESVAEAGGFYRFSAKALAAIVLVNMCADLAKLLLIDLSSNSSVNVSLPILPLLFCLAALIVSRFMAAHKRLRDDNDLFV